MSGGEICKLLKTGLVAYCIAWRAVFTIHYNTYSVRYDTRQRDDLYIAGTNE